MIDGRPPEAKIWNALDWYYEYSEAGFHMVPGSDILLIAAVAIGLVIFSVAMIPCFIIGVMFGKREKNPSIGPVFDDDR